MVTVYIRDGILYPDESGTLAVVRNLYQNSVANSLPKSPAHFHMGAIPT
jgi:hypothetical protein